MQSSLTSSDWFRPMKMAIIKDKQCSPNLLVKSERISTHDQYAVEERYYKKKQQVKDRIVQKVSDRLGRIEVESSDW